MRRFLTNLLLAAALTLALSACGMKEAVQDKTRAILDDITEASDSQEANEERGGGRAVAKNGVQASAGEGNQASAKGESNQAAGEQSRDVPVPGRYWDRVRDKVQNAPNEGYVWTITIDDSETIDVMGLAKVDYHLKLSCSHVGKDMTGPYGGELEVSYDADLSGMVELMTPTGGSVDYDADGWFKNDAFLMEADGYDAEAEDIFLQSIEPVSDVSAEEQAIIDAYMGSFLDSMGSGSKDFEHSETPAAYWYDWAFRMTEGDMSGFIEMTGIAYGTTSGGGSVDASGVYTEGSATASSPLFGTFHERYSESIETPFPYIIRIYETGEVVFELHSANGGPVVVKFYGTVDKIPVEQTILVNP